MKSLAQKNGFTLIELLVVIAVIGILAAVILASLNEARAKARDARRIADIRTIQTALEMYYADNGRYPQTGWVHGYTATWETGVLGTALEPYLPTMPVDPINTSTGSPITAGNYTYSYYASLYAGTTTTQQWYMLVVRPENPTTLTSTRRSVACDGTSFQYSGTITSGGSCVQ